MTRTRFSQDLPDDVDLAVGQVLELPLTGAMGAGNVWSSRTDGDAVHADVAVTPPQRSVTPPGAMPPASSSARETLRITALRLGSATVHLQLGRSWEPDALAEHLLRVRVHEQP